MDYSSLDTPAVLIDLDILEANIEEMSRLTSEAGVRLRPHIKVHGSAEIAKMQLAAGACGVEVGSIDQAESLANEGISDILIAHPFYDERKLEIFRRLLKYPSLTLTFVVDMIEQAVDMSKVAIEANKPISILVIVNTGGRRYGTLPEKPTVELVKKLVRLSGIQFQGLYTHEVPEFPNIRETAFNTATLMIKTALMLKREGITVNHVSMGASPTFLATCEYLKEGLFPEITEIHPGNRVIGDIMYVRAKGNTLKSCALSVLASVQSTANKDWAVIDAGYKTFGAESIIDSRDATGFFWNGMANLGPVKHRPDLWFGRMSAEVGQIYYKEKGKKLKIGDRLEVITNNSALVNCMHKELVGVRNGEVERTIPITVGPR